MALLNARASEILMLIRQHGPLSRRELHEYTALRPNTIGQITGSMLRERLLREGTPKSDGRGRPRQPLEIDSSQRHVVGLAFDPGKVSACRVNLHGRRDGSIQERTFGDSSQMIVAAAALIRGVCADGTIAVGIGATGFVDPQTRAILTSSATMRRSPTNLQPVYDAAGKCPVLLENDMHARAFHWLMSQSNGLDEDVLLVDLRDGALGAALLIDGHPNRGCIIAGNELGHTRLPVETDLCYCGHPGCLERICSSAFLRRQTGRADENLYRRLANFHGGDEALTDIAGYLATGIGNAINFIRPNRVLLTGRVAESLPFCNHLITQTRKLLLAPLADRVRIDIWDTPALASAEAAAWVALAALFRGSWSSAIEREMPEDAKPLISNGSKSANTKRLAKSA
jgi:predicted NBD/HSP70 family sugar kinase